MKNIPQHNYPKKILTAGALVLAAATSTVAQPKAFMEAGTAQPPLPSPPPPKAPAPAATEASTNALAAAKANPLDKFFNGQIPDAITEGKFNLNVRLRYEQVDQDNAPGITGNSYAPTIRTRFGYTTAPLYGFQGMLEGVNVSVLGPEHNYNAAGSNGQGARPVVGDPPLTRLNQAWLGYTYTNLFAIRAGEQRIVLDDQRFIGDSAWRQNMQTFDAVSVGSEPLKHLNLYYSYLWDVHRVYGDVSGLPAANGDFDSRSHLINVSYSGWEYGRFVGYAYLLDLHNAAGDANSCATYGGYFAGGTTLGDNISMDYRAEFAWQTDYADSPLEYGTENTPSVQWLGGSISDAPGQRAARPLWICPGNVAGPNPCPLRLPQVQRRLRQQQLRPGIRCSCLPEIRQALECLGRICQLPRRRCSRTGAHRAGGEHPEVLGGGGIQFLTCVKPFP